MKQRRGEMSDELDREIGPDAVNHDLNLECCIVNVWPNNTNNIGMTKRLTSVSVSLSLSICLTNTRWKQPITKINWQHAQRFTSVLNLTQPHFCSQRMTASRTRTRLSLSLSTPWVCVLIVANYKKKLVLEIGTRIPLKHTLLHDSPHYCDITIQWRSV